MLMTSLPRHCAIASGVVWVLALSTHAESPTTAPAKSRTFAASYVATLKQLPPGTKHLELWLPVPVGDEHQAIAGLKIDSPLAYKVEAEPQYGNTVLRAWGDEPAAGTTVKLSFVCTRRESRGTPAAAAPPERLSQPDVLGVIDDRVRDLARAATGGRGDIRQQERGIYDAVLARMVYDKTGTGWGRGDTRFACDVGRGNCTDFHALFISMTRAMNVPARFEMGFSIPGKDGGVVAGYHCWAEFYDPPRGWVPVDCSEGWKQKDKRDYFFGTLDENRVQFSVGRDITLPGMRGTPVNFFVYPYAEFDGKPGSGVETEVEFGPARK